MMELDDRTIRRVITRLDELVKYHRHEAAMSQQNGDESDWRYHTLIAEGVAISMGSVRLLQEQYRSDVTLS